MEIAKTDQVIESIEISKNYSNFESQDFFENLKFRKKLKMFSKLQKFAKEISDFEKYKFFENTNSKRSFEIVQFRNLSKCRSNFLSCTRKKILSPQKRSRCRALRVDLEIGSNVRFRKNWQILFFKESNPKTRFYFKILVLLCVK